LFIFPSERIKIFNKYIAQNNGGCSSTPTHRWVVPTAQSPIYWQLVFIHIRLFIICLSLFLVIVNLHQTIHEAQIYFVFLSVGNPKTVLKGGYSGW